MIKYSAILFLLFSISPITSAQGIKGTITNNEGDPVPFATVYISELKKGTTSNIRGEYLLNLKPGSYNIYFQSLGFSPEIRKLTIGEEERELNIKLQVQYYVIPEVRVVSTGEDPAYSIMRKAIGYAPYYLNQVKHYKAEVYIKGSVIVNKIPQIMKKRISVNEESVKEGETYLIESINEIEFNAPDKYNQTIIAQHSTFPESGGGTDISPMDVVSASFYQPLLADIAISPLAPNAMAHYKFRYEGSTPQGKYIINKISVIPKRKSQQVFEGTIYIIEDYWCLHSVDLVNENLAGSIMIKQVYIPVEEDIWMPVSHNFTVNISIVGVKADGEYGSAVTYHEVEQNLDLARPADLPLLTMSDADQQTTEEQPVSKEQAKIEQLLSKEDLTNRDMVRLSRLMEKEAEKLDPESKELEIKRTTNFTVNEEADKRDSSYWNAVRPIPLSGDEMKSIRVNDSLTTGRKLVRSEAAVDTAASGENSSSSPGKVIRAIASGKSFYSEERNFRFSYGGLVNTDKFTFNTVDGFRYGTDIAFRYRWEGGTSLTLTPSADWAFARERLLWRVNSTLNYSRMKQARLFIWAGRSSNDFNRSAGISPGLNMMTSLLFRENYLRLYESNYINVSHRHEIINGLYAELRYNYEDRRMLLNNSDFSLFRKDAEYSPNLPVNQYLPDPADPSELYNLGNHIHHEGIVQLSFTPRQKYYINNGVKSPAGSSYPTFRLTLKHGINKYPGEEGRSYDFIRAEASKSRSIGAFSEYGWSIKAGGFINNRGVEFPDFVHFNSQPLPVLLTNYRDVFMLPGYYTLATPEYFTEAHFRFTTPYLLLKLLPGLSNTLIRENISLAWLYTPHTRNYYELGYALSEVFLLGRIGIYAGFEDLTWKGAGVRFTFIFD